jgi:ferredoxin
MAMKIVVAQCVACGACEFECANAAIRVKRGVYVIDAGLCTECNRHYASPQCATICPAADCCVPA